MFFFPRHEGGLQNPARQPDSPVSLSGSRDALARALSVSASRAANRSRVGRPWISDPVLRAAQLRAEILRRDPH